MKSEYEKLKNDNLSKHNPETSKKSYTYDQWVNVIENERCQCVLMKWTTHREDNTNLLHTTNTAWNRKINRPHYKSRGDLHTLSCHRYAMYSQDKTNKGGSVYYTTGWIDIISRMSHPITKICMCHKASLRKYPQMK